jgi:hypothetical protein
MEDNIIIGDKMANIKKILDLYNKERRSLVKIGEKVKISKGVKRQNLQIDYYNKVYLLKAIELEIKTLQLEEEKHLREVEFICL